MSDRYFVESFVGSSHARLSGAEAHHLLHVMRAKEGSRVKLFDNSGWEFDAVVERAGRSEVELEITGREKIDREAAIAVTLGVALPKGDRQKWLVEKLVELGVARLVPLVTERGVAQPGESALQRLRRGVIEASKQCGRNRLMEIAEPMAWPEFVADGGRHTCRLVAHPLFERQRERVQLASSSESVAVAVGPEGGFTDDEINLAVARQWQPLGLGPRILRVETAAVALAAWVIGCGW